jgi:hypothetical protein
VCKYLPPSPPGEAMRALGSGIVTESRHEDFADGDPLLLPPLRVVRELGSRGTWCR